MYDHVGLYRRRLEYGWYTRQELSEIMEVSENEILKFRFAEEWISRDEPFPSNYYGEKEKEYSALSMGYATRFEIAAGLVSVFEECGGPLLVATNCAMIRYTRMYPDVDQTLLRACLYRSRQFQYAQTAANTMLLTDDDALAAIEEGFCLLPSTLVTLRDAIDAVDAPFHGHCFDMDHALRFQALLSHYATHGNAVLFPEFSSQAEALQ